MRRKNESDRAVEMDRSLVIMFDPFCPNALDLHERSYFSRTNNSTKIAQIPTVTGNCTTAASRM